MKGGDFGFDCSTCFDGMRICLMSLSFSSTVSFLLDQTERKNYRLGYEAKILKSLFIG